MELRRTSGVLIPSALLFFVVATYLLSTFNHERHLATHRTTVPKAEFHAPRQNLWAELTEDEANDVNDFLSQELAYLNLTKRPKSARDNFIFIVETLRPNKTDATPYLYSHDHAKPARWAKAAVAQNFPDDGPHMVYYQVGPLPLTNSSVITPLTHIFNSGRHYVRNPIHDFAAIQDFALSMAEDISDITMELLGAVANRADPQDPEGLLASPRASRVEGGGLTMWMQFYRPGYGSGARTILPQGLYAKVDARSSDVEQWRVGEFYYNGVLYSDAAALREALRAPEFQRTPANLDGPWTETEDFNAQPEGRELPPPVSIQPYGPRYRLDKEQQFVSWFGFEFYITTAQATGVSLFDIRFKGERIMYELGLQEAMAHYAGDDPMQGGLEFMDSFFGMGKNAFELVPGYDCPAYADYLDLEWHQAYQTHKQPNSICIFEYTSDALLSRHTAQYSVTASRNTFLVVRSVSTVGNYDYTIDYIFYLDGSIEVKVRASGFIFGAFYTANNTKSEDEYGHRIHDALSSSMHDHVINFKADMDVAGPANDMVRLAIEPITKAFEWDQPEVKARNTMHLVEYPVSHETGLDWPKNSGEFYLVYSASEKNAWGERKGYRVTSGTGMGNPPHLTILNSTTLGDSARWAEQDLWVVRRKDTEPRSADPLNYFAPHDPLIDFARIADGESLAHGGKDEYDGDLVVYFNVGAHHVPHSGDVPNTLMHTSASSVLFVPHNLHDRDPSRASAQG
ncbi:Membrane primary amine oxidase, partial [Teratosphaeria destructans]